MATAVKKQTWLNISDQRHDAERVSEGGFKKKMVVMLLKQLQPKKILTLMSELLKTSARFL